MIPIPFCPFAHTSSIYTHQIFCAYDIHIQFHDHTCLWHIYGNMMYKRSCSWLYMSTYMHQCCSYICSVICENSITCLCKLYFILMPYPLNKCICDIVISVTMPSLCIGIYRVPLMHIPVKTQQTATYNSPYIAMYVLQTYMTSTLHSLPYMQNI